MVLSYGQGLLLTACRVMLMQRAKEGMSYSTAWPASAGSYKPAQLRVTNCSHWLTVTTRLGSATLNGLRGAILTSTGQRNSNRNPNNVSHNLYPNNRTLTPCRTLLSQPEYEQQMKGRADTEAEVRACCRFVLNGFEEACYNGTFLQAGWADWSGGMPAYKLQGSTEEVWCYYSEEVEVVTIPEEARTCDQCQP